VRLKGVIFGQGVSRIFRNQLFRPPEYVHATNATNLAWVYAVFFAGSVAVFVGVLVGVVLDRRRNKPEPS